MAGVDDIKNIGDKLKSISGIHNYNYAKNIKPPKELGMGTTGNLKTLRNNINGIKSYMEIISSGGGEASRRGGKPLGNRYFMDMGLKCKDIDTGEKKNLYSYINNVPTGNVPFLSATTGSNTGVQGLIPGVIEKAAELNPVTLFSKMNFKVPDCVEVTLPVDGITDSDGKEVNDFDSQYVSTKDLKNMNGCIFDDTAKDKPANKKALGADGETVWEGYLRKGQTGCENIGDGGKEEFNVIEDINNRIKEQINNIKDGKVVNLKDKSLANFFNLMFAGLLVYLMSKMIKRKLNLK
tara:strand:+ start:227 stop:1108 length:882 start_codon:yes stop_codon:yes gene_type:complete